MSNLDYKEGRGDYYLAEGKREQRKPCDCGSEKFRGVHSDSCTRTRGRGPDQPKDDEGPVA